MMNGALARGFAALQSFLVTLAIVSAAPVAHAADTKVHPALWTVRSKTATVYMIGSIHILPIGMHWRTPEIDKAMDAADIFYFETSLDPESISEIARYGRYHGDLPDRVTLRSLLDKKTLADYQHALSIAHLTADSLDTERPWRAAHDIGHAYAQRMNQRADFGVDFDVWDYAREHHRTLRAFETTQQQIDLFIPKDQKFELAQFASSMRDLEIEYGQYRAVVAAWSAGDVKAVGALVNKSLESEPLAKKILLDDRNESWMRWFDAMLSSTGTYFVTVGTGHMVGPKGVPALLRARGYHVDGPQA